MTDVPPSDPNQPGSYPPPPPASGYPPPAAQPPGPAGPYGAPDQYQQQGYGYTPGPGGPAKNNGKAVGGFVCALVGLLLFGIILGIVAVILGAMARGEIERSGGAQKGSGLATAAIVIGIIDIVAFFVLLSALS